MTESAPFRGPVVFFTGAGISVGAGLPTYRGTGGIYESGHLEPPTLDDVSPERLPALWERFRPRLSAFDELGPAVAHRRIAALEDEMDTDTTVVTQNVDGLHTLAGSSRVIELHGTLRTVRCLAHAHEHAVGAARWVVGDVPRCPTCGDMCRPNVVLFGESLPMAAFASAQEAIRAARTVVAVGTSAQVFPAAHLIDPQFLADSTCVWINPQTPPPDGLWIWLRGRADDELPRIVNGYIHSPIVHDNADRE
jgi:NAD-dependent deacetylase